MKTRPRWLWAPVLAVAGAAVLVFATREVVREPAPADSATLPAAAPTLGAAPKGAKAAPGNLAPPPATGSSDREADALAKALAAADEGAARVAARDLRRRLRTDPEALLRAIELLLDRATRADVRMALALVLGTLPKDAGDAALLQAIGRFPKDVEFLRCALLALGAERDPEDDDDVFDLGDRPYGASGPGGLGITVRRAVPEGEVERALTLHLQRTEPDLRWAAARALGASLSAGPVRGAFLSALSSERSDDVAAVLGEPLAQWAGSALGSVDAANRDAVVSALIARAGESGLDSYRFRMEDEFERIPVPAREREGLARLTRRDHPFAVRAFAITVLARAAARGGEAAVSDARWALLAAAFDEDAAIRDLAARWLGRLPYDSDTANLLAATARRDAAWNVRFTAMESLAATAPRDEAMPVLRELLRDPEPRVAERAAALLKSLDGAR